jgi:hypothetical protein
MISVAQTTSGLIVITFHSTSNIFSDVVNRNVEIKKEADASFFISTLFYSHSMVAGGLDDMS